ncbi:Vesicle-associated protein 4-2 [Ancistrocladus abbreviatus]
MSILEQKEKQQSEGGKVWGLFKLPFRQATQFSSSSSSSSSAFQHKNGFQHNQSQSSSGNLVGEGSNSGSSSGSVSSVARSFLPARRRLRLDPTSKLFFPFEPGKQVRSAIRIKNTSKSHVAFKFQTTAPKSCFMRPPGAILAPGESLIATVFKFVEHPENNEKPVEQKSKVKFKIMSLKVKGPMDFVPELFDEQKDQVAVEQILRVVFLDADRPSPALEKLKRMLAEAEAELEAHKKPPEDNGPKIIGEGLVIDEWKERRERYLARQQIEGVDSA